MSLDTGTRLGPYEILAPLGAGGMGEVYRARDAKLGREVAIKVLPEAVAIDTERLARFEREARTLATLNHPNIAQIYGIEESAGTRALVMELVEGEDLSLVVARGAQPPAMVEAIARQIAAALEAAHELGIVHRDLKPANIVLRADGAVKVLDFGLAKSVDPSGSSASFANSPTLTSPATMAGVILGTAAYMSPEQARGGAVDKRTDIWAFGVIVYELLSGERLFEGDTVSDTLAAVLRQDIDLSRLPAETPPPLRALIAHCLQRDAKKRLRDIGDARFDATAPPPAPLAAAAPRSQRALVVALSLIALAAVAVATRQTLTARRDTAPSFLSIAMPPGLVFESGPAISRDGRRIAFVAGDGEKAPQLYVRDLGEPASRLIAGTGDAANPFFSPDGEWIGCYAPQGLFKVRADGGAPVGLAPSRSMMGATWMDDGTAVFKQSWNSGLFTVPASGGDVKPLLTNKAMLAYALAWPYAVPGKHEIVFQRWGTSFDTFVLDTHSGKTRKVPTSSWQRIACTADGRLVVVNGDALSLASLSVSGDPIPLVRDAYVRNFSGSARFDISQTGVLAYVPAAPENRVVALVDREGRTTKLPIDVAPDIGAALELSPDGQRAVTQQGARIVVLDFARHTKTKIDPAPKGVQASPVWNLDGRSIVYADNLRGKWEIYRKAASGEGNPELVFARLADQKPLSFAPDGSLLCGGSSETGGSDLWILSPSGAATAWLATPANEDNARFSPDGRLIAFVSDASGRLEIYIQSRNGGDDRVQVSTDSGNSPCWSPRGDRLFYWQRDVLMEVAVSTAGGLSVGAPSRVFAAGWTKSSFDVMPDGQHFLMVDKARESAPTQITVVFNWPELAKAQKKD